MKKIAIIGTAGIPACYGGFETLAENLTKYSTSECAYTVYCSEKIYSDKKTQHNGATLDYIPLSANGSQSIPYDIISLFKSRKFDVILVLGVSGCIFLPVLRMLTKAKIITNIDGLEWKRDKWSGFIRRFLKFSERMAVKYSDVIIADNEKITNYVREEYNVEARTIAYGGDHVLLSDAIDGKGEYFLTICRIEPENNIDMILSAFSKTSLPLKFVGNWQANQYGKALYEKYSKFDNIEMINPVYELDKLFELRANCYCYVHGHSAGGTNPSLVEIMHFAKPIFAFDCSFNRYSTDNRCFYFKDADDLQSQLIHVGNFVEKLTQCATDMHALAKDKYCWKDISSAYERIFLE
jgi:glycosyltransferase involved in cell wall biosynthesis